MTPFLTGLDNNRAEMVHQRAYRQQRGKRPTLTAAKIVAPHKQQKLLPKPIEPKKERTKTQREDEEWFGEKVQLLLHPPLLPG
jgi:hypothetical protein